MIATGMRVPAMTLDFVDEVRPIDLILDAFASAIRRSNAAWRSDQVTGCSPN